MKQAFILPAVLLLGFSLRVAGIGFGLPHVYHQDEAIVVNHAMAIGADGWNTKTYLPPQFASYLLFLFYGLYFVAGRIFGLFSGTTDFALQFLKDPTAFYLIGRFVLGAVFGTATIALLYRIGERFFSKQTAFWAALFLSVSLLHTAHSHYVYMDVAVTFAVTLLFFYLFRYLEAPTMKTALAAGAVFGWAVSVKYTAVYFFPAMMLAFFLAPKTDGRSSALRLLGAGLLSIAVYALVSPYSFLDWNNFIAQVRGQSAARGQQDVLHHLNYSLLNGTSAVFLFTALAGAVLPQGLDRRKTAVLLAGAFIYYAVNTAFSQPFARYMMPVLPILCLFASQSVVFWSKRRPWASSALGALIAANLLIPTLQFTVLLNTDDTRTQALRWMEAHVPEKSTVVLDSVFFGPRLTQTPEQIAEKRSYLSEADRGGSREKRIELTLKTVQGKKTYNVYYALAPEQSAEKAFLFARPLVAPEAGALQKIGAEYVVLNYSDPSEGMQAWKSASGGLELAASFNPYKRTPLKMPGGLESLTGPPDSQRELFERKSLGPYLEIYRVKK